MATTDASAFLLEPINASLLPQYAPVVPSLTPLFSLRCTVQFRAVVGQTGQGARSVIPITGAELSAPKAAPSSPFADAIGLQGGADCLLRDANGVSRLDARYAFRLASGHYLYVQSRGTRYGYTPQAAQALDQGREVEPTEYYFRLHLQLESDDPDPTIQHACRGIVVASAVRGATSVVYDAYLME